MSSSADAEQAQKGSSPDSAAGARELLRLLTSYKAWADELTYDSVRSLPPGELERERPTRFGTILGTLGHAWVVDDIFRAHLTGARHRHTDRRLVPLPDISALWSDVEATNAWYVAFADSLDERELQRTVEFEFVGGGRGAMTRAEILLHVVNHSTYHRGFVGDMCYHIPATPPANDLTVYLRDFRR